MPSTDSTTFTYADKYSFYAEWYNEIADVVKPFILSFYPLDGTLELFDLKCRRIFLRRTKIDGISLKSLYKGAVINVFCRQVIIAGYANQLTERVYKETIQNLFFLIKPNCLQRMGEILHFLEQKEYKIIMLKMGKMTPEGAEKFHGKIGDSALKEQEHIEQLTSGECVAVEVVGESGISKWIAALGESIQNTPDRLPCHGHHYSTDADVLPASVHFSFSPEKRQQERAMWASTERKNATLIKTMCKLDGSTCCIIKPHAVDDGLVGRIISCIYESGFSIEAMNLMHLDRAAAERFYEVYKGVVPEYASMVTELSSGACLALEVRHSDEPSSSTKIFRQLVGANDPVLAKELQPNSIRAKFGRTTVMNAVHCTDLPEDAKLELEFFFVL